MSPVKKVHLLVVKILLSGKDGGLKAAERETPHSVATMLSHFRSVQQFIHRNRLMEDEPDHEVLLIQPPAALCVRKYN